MYLFSNDMYLIKTWQKHLGAFFPFVVDDFEKLLEIEDSFILCNIEALDEVDYTLKAILAKKNKILLLDSIPNLSQGKRFLKLGVQGYGNVMMSKTFLESAIMTIDEGFIWLHPQLMQNLILDLNDDDSYDETLLINLTSKQTDVALLLKEGYTNSQISQELNMSINTVKTHAKRVYSKLNVNDRLSLALLFQKKTNN